MNSVDNTTPKAITNAKIAIDFVVLLGFIFEYRNHAKKQIVETAACKLGKQLKEVSLANTM